jgi:hypothetical protein
LSYASDDHIQRLGRGGMDGIVEQPATESCGQRSFV